MASLKFNIDGQIITRTDNLKVVADSIDYLYAEFIFPSEWSGTKTAIFTMGRKTWSLLIKDGSCKVPWEVLKKSTSFTVSVVCGNRITSNVVTVPVIPSGYKEGDTPKEPTPDVYSQILGQLDTIKDVANTADRNASNALNAANNIGAGVNEAKWLAEMANSKSSQALNIAQNIPNEYYTKDDIDNMGFASEGVIYEYSYSKEESDETYNGLNAHISAVERTVDDLDSKLSTVYKYQISTTWHLIQFGLIESNSGYPFEVGMVFNIEEDDEMPSAYSHTGEAVSIKAGDNIAIAVIDNGIPKFDKLSATINLSNYATTDVVDKKIAEEAMISANIYAKKSNVYTKAEIDSKVSAVYKYKGSVEHFENLPITSEIGDVWNINSNYQEAINTYPAAVEYIMESVGEDGAHTNIHLKTPLSVVGYRANLFNKDKVFVENILVQYNDTVAIKDTSLITDDNHPEGTIIYLEFTDEEAQQYNTTPMVTFNISAGDNVAWTGTSWDVLAGTVDLSNYATKGEVSELTTKTIILSNTMTTDEIVTAINTAPKGTVFDIQTSLDLYDVNVSFPERSVVYSSTANRKNITFGYSDTSDPEVWNQSWYLSFGAFSKISDISVNFSDNGTANVGANFGEGCKVTNCYFYGYSPFDWRDNCTFVNCVLSYYVYSLSNGGSYIGCDFEYTDIYEGIDLRNVYLSDCSCESFKLNNNTLAIAAKIKSLNPGMKLVDSEGNEIKGLYATADDVSSMINSAVGLAMEGEY